MRTSLSRSSLKILLRGADIREVCFGGTGIGKGRVDRGEQNRPMSRNGLVIMNPAARDFHSSENPATVFPAMLSRPGDEPTHSGERQICSPSGFSLRKAQVPAP